MGHPKHHRRKFARPLKPWDKARIEEEKALLKKYGLRRKHELWRAEAIVRGFRQRARKLLAEPHLQRQEELLAKLATLGIKVKSLDEVLDLKLEDLLGRRLQTILHRRGTARTPRHARQLIVHRRVLVGGRVQNWPSYLVSQEDENKLEVKTEKAAKVSQQNGE